MLSWMYINPPWYARNMIFKFTILVNKGSITRMLTLVNGHQLRHDNNWITLLFTQSFFFLLIVKWIISVLKLLHEKLVDKRQDSKHTFFDKCPPMTIVHCALGVRNVEGLILCYWKRLCVIFFFLFFMSCSHGVFF